MAEITIGMSVASEISMDTGKMIFSWNDDIVTNGDMETWTDVIINGDFDTDTDWAKGALWTITGGKLVGTAVTSNCRQAGVLTVGKTYESSYIISDFSGGSVSVNVGGTGGIIRNADGTYVEILKAAATADFLFNGGAPFTAKIDDAIAILQDPTGWDGTENGTGTIRRSTVNNGGTYSVDLYNPAGGGNTVLLKEDIVGVIGTLYRVSFDVRCDTAVRSIRVKSSDSAGPLGTLSEIYSIVLADTWYSVEYEFIWDAADNAVEFSTNSNGHFYVDNVALESRTYTADKTMAMK